MDLKVSYKYLLVTAILSFPSGLLAESPQRPGANFNNHELRVGQASVRLPSFDASKLDENVRNLLLSAKSLAEKYDQKLTSVEKRIKLFKTNRVENHLLEKGILVKDVETLRRDLSNDYSNIKRQFDAINSHQSFSMRRNIMDVSLMSRLNEFMQLLGNLPAKIMCFIYDCNLESGYVPVTTSELIPTETDSYDLVDEN